LVVVSDAGDGISIDLAEKLTALAAERMFYTSGGSEGDETALKIGAGNIAAMVSKLVLGAGGWSFRPLATGRGCG